DAFFVLHGEVGGEGHDRVGHGVLAGAAEATVFGLHVLSDVVADAVGEVLHLFGIAAADFRRAGGCDRGGRRRRQARARFENRTAPRGGIHHAEPLAGTAAAGVAARFLEE